MDSLTTSKEFYTQEETARLLKVTTRRLYDYRRDGRLRFIKQGLKVFYVKEDVNKFYRERGSKGSELVPSNLRISERLEKLERTVEILKLGLGFGKNRAPWSTSELLLFYQSAMDHLVRPGWDTKQLSAFADEVMSIREEDLRKLHVIKGDNCWAPIFDLLQRMTVYVEGLRDFPDCGLGTLHARLLRSRDRLYGIIHAARIVSYKTGPDLDSLADEENTPKISCVTAYMIEHVSYQAATHKH